MQPIVDRLETEFAGQVVVDRHNAASKEGKALMNAYGLRAHPSFVIVAPDGKALWTLTGQTEEMSLRKKLQQHVK